jgi:hypothetical protein
MEIVALVVAAFLQVVGLTLDQLRETVEAVKTALVQQYVDATEGARLQVDGVRRPDREAPAAEALDVALQLAAHK